MQSAIVVHGGAGDWDLDSDRLRQATADCRTAVASGQAELLAGRSAMEAVEAAVRVLEDSPHLDAGRGSHLNAKGDIEMDAIIMDGATLNLGAVAAVRRVLHPISLARAVMFENEHNFLVGTGAESFADSINFPRCEITDLLADSDLEEYLALRRGLEFEPQASSTSLQSGNTVGAVALDSAGNLAAATSTGGTRGKQPGRVGDSPLVGSGAYADNWTAAVSATGHGEALMKVLISKRVCDLVASGLSAQKACEAAIYVLEERVSGLGGLIAVDARGRVGVAFNTKAMPCAHAVGNERIASGS